MPDANATLGTVYIAVTLLGWALFLWVAL